MDHMKDDTKRRAELADFLRTRRARLRPEQLGLSTLGRRRTPGLRREEVAQLAGVGVSWYTWLEQGRDITVSCEQGVKVTIWSGGSTGTMRTVLESKRRPTCG